MQACFVEFFTLTKNKEVFVNRRAIVCAGRVFEKKLDSVEAESRNTGVFVDEK